MTTLANGEEVELELEDLWYRAAVEWIRGWRDYASLVVPFEDRVRVVSAVPGDPTQPIGTTGDPIGT